MSVIGRKTKTRGVWRIKPVTQVKQSKKNYDRNKHKQATKRRIDEHV
jgi:hypothetical protein